MEKKAFGISLICAGMVMYLASAGTAMQVTQNSNASELAAALTEGNTGIQVISAAISGDPLQSGTFTNLSQVYSKKGIDHGLVLGSGKVEDYSDGPNTSDSFSTDFGTSATPAQTAMLTPITGKEFHYDVVQLDITFKVDDGFDMLWFNMAFGSEEFPEYVNTPFNDGFGIYLNGDNIAFAGGLPVDIDHPWMSPLVGTELDGTMNAQFQATPYLSGDVNTLTFILADASDGIYDTTVYFSALGASQPEIPDDSQEHPVVPEPSSAVVLLTMAAPSAASILRRKR